MSEQQQHTPEPWHVTGLHPLEIHEGIYTVTWNPRLIESTAELMLHGVGVIPDGWPNAEANAERIVTCVNWCADFSNKRLAELVSLEDFDHDHTSLIDGLEEALRHLKNILTATNSPGSFILAMVAARKYLVEQEGISLDELNPDENAADMVKRIAERLIGGYVQAVEQDDISGVDNWITEPDHWGFDLDDGKALLTLLGMSDEEIEATVQAVRENLGEDDDEASDGD